MLPKEPGCSGCPLEFIGQGFSYPTGDGSKGVFCIAEAPGETEAAAGEALVGKAGHYLFNALRKVGIERSDLALFNAIACRPPDNKLAGMPYEAAALSHCSPNLDGAIDHYRRVAAGAGKTFTIVTLGKTAFKRVLHLDEKRHERLLKSDYLCYPFWSEAYGAYVLAADHPSYLMRGNHHLVSILQFAFQRAMEIAQHGLTYANPSYLLDPGPEVFSAWVEEYLAELSRNPDETFLSYDIETPYKQGADEEEVSKEDDDDYTILRCSFSYQPNTSVTVPWRAEYRPALQRIFVSDGNKVGWNNCPTPDQKILTADLRWIEAGILQVGDELVGVDEDVQEGRRMRRFRSSTVTNIERSLAEVFELVFSDGSKVKVTRDHPWLIPQKDRNDFGLGSAWVTTSQLKVGQRIPKYFDLWEPDNSRDAGYLAGIFDGEGHTSFKDEKGHCHWQLAFTQNEGPTLDYIVDLLHRKSFNHANKPASPNNGEKCCNVYMRGGIAELARFMGIIRPPRLMRKFTPEFLGATFAVNRKVVLESIRNLGEQEIVKIATSERTYVLEGFVAHNCNYDDPRIRAQMPLNGNSIDAMLAWHVLNSALPKSLAFVTPFYVQNTPMWKHLSEAEPAFYNAKDADMALQNWLGIRRDLQANGRLWDVFSQHVIEMNKVFGYMRDQGVTLDLAARAEAETKLAAHLASVEAKIEAVVPTEARSLKVYKKIPKSTEGLILVPGEANVKVCSVCGKLNVKADHFKSVGKKRLKAGEPENFCHGGYGVKTSMGTELWALPLPFKLSNQSLQRYLRTQRHMPIVDAKSKKITFDEKAMLRLRKQHPKDSLYPLVGEFRKYQKLLSVYIGQTEYEEIIVQDGYELQPGEKWADG